MANLSNDFPTEFPLSLRTYKAPWRGELIFACTKCRKKLKKHHGAKFANLKKWFKKRAKANEEGPEVPAEVRILGIDCVKLCPKGGITVMRQRQLCKAGNEVSIIRSEADLEGLYAIITGSQQQDKLAKSA